MTNRDVSLYRILAYVAAGLFIGYVGCTGDWYGSQDATVAFSVFYYRAIPVVLAMALVVWIFLSRREPARWTGLRPPYPEIWIFILIATGKLLWPIGHEIDDFPPFPHQHLVFTTACFAALLAAPVILFNRSTRFLLLFLLSAEVAGVLLFDLVHARHLGFLPSLADFQSRQVALTAETFRSLLTLRDLLYVADLPVWAALYLFAPPEPAKPFSPRFRSMLAGLLGALLLGLPGSVVIGQIMRRGHVNTALRGDAMVVNAVGIPGYHLLDYHAFRDAAAPLSPGEIAAVHAWFSANAGDTVGRSPWFGSGRGMNLILVSAEAVQDFVPELVYQGQEITPNLNRLARESVLRARLHDVTGSGRSSDADFASLHSLFPSPDGASTYRFAGNHFRGLPALLGEEGYSSTALTFAEGYVWNWRRFYPASGFQTSLFRSDILADPSYPNAIDDRLLFDAVVDRIERDSGSPFFMLVHTASTHHPFLMAERVHDLKVEDLDRGLVGKYLRSLRYFDEAFGRFLKDLEDRGIADRTVIALYGDHDAGIQNEPGLEELLGYSPSDPVSRRRADVVPFMIRVPGINGGPISARGSQVDVGPTLLSIMGLSSKGLYMVGHDLLRETHALVTFPDGSATDGSRLYLRESGIHPGEGCFRLETGEELDPAVCRDMIAPAAEKARVSHLVVRGDLIPKRTP